MSSSRLNQPQLKKSKQTKCMSQYTEIARLNVANKHGFFATHAYQSKVLQRNNPGYLSTENAP